MEANLLSTPDSPPARLPLDEILRDEDYRHRLRLARTDAAAFFGPWRPPDPPDLLSQRRHWLRLAPERHAPFLDAATPLVEELWDLARTWGMEVASGCDEAAAGEPLDPRARWRELGGSCEADLILLLREGATSRMVAGAVCFPSSWSPAEKLGQPLAAIHQVVPGLNEELGPAIDGFLARLRPGTTWLRANWGLSRSPELNQHPERNLPRLAAPAVPSETFLRLEHQALLVLPRTGGIVFGIRVEQRSLAELVRQRPLAVALARALRTMPEPMARYKGLSPVRSQIAAWLESGGNAAPVDDPITPP